jgi:hypothetical protein
MRLDGKLKVDLLFLIIFKQERQYVLIFYNLELYVHKSCASIKKLLCVRAVSEVLAV